MTLQGQILDLLDVMRSQQGLTLVFISHDLPIVRRIADRAVVVFAGQVIEEGPPAALFAAPAHPYTAALVAAVPIPDPLRARLELTRAVPAGSGRVARPSACAFLARCPHAHDRCESKPPLRPVAPDRSAACWLHQGSS